jgi:hypothetical protein
VLHIEEPLGENMEYAMGILLASLNTEATMQLKQHLEGTAIHEVVIPNYLIKTLEGESIVINDMSMIIDLPMTMIRASAPIRYRRVVCS